MDLMPVETVVVLLPNPEKLQTHTEATEQASLEECPMLETIHPEVTHLVDQKHEMRQLTHHQTASHPQFTTTYSLHRK